MAKVNLEVGKDGVGIITLNDPDSLNAMSEAMASDFRAVVETLRPKAKDLCALILTGAGRAFSAGGDLKMLDGKRALSGEANRLLMLGFYDSFLSLRDLGVPLIAAINGAAVGAGLCVASACDIRLAATGAKLGFTFVRLGLHPGMGATYFLPKVIGHAHAAELLLTGRVVEADYALRIGLVSRVVAPDQVLPEARAIAAELREGGPEAIRQLLESIRNPQATLDQALQREALCQAVNYGGEEFAEGVKAVMEKRKANFRA